MIQLTFCRMVVFCSVYVAGLRWHAHQYEDSALQKIGYVAEQSKVNQNSAVMQKLSDAHCNDIEMVNTMGPVVESLSTFFEKIHHKTIYPWILTGINALRYGGVSLPLNDGQVTAFDHDLDFLIQMPTSSEQEVREMITQWRLHLEQATGLSSFQEQGPDNEEYQRYTPGGAYHYWIRVERPTHVTKMAKKQHRELVTMEYETAHQRKLSPDEQSRLLDQVPYRYKNSTMIDLLIKFNNGVSISEDYAPSSKRMMFLGYDFPMPRNAERLHQDIKATYTEPSNVMEHSNQLCDLEVPAGFLKEDPNPSLDVTRKIQTCSAILDDHGFASTYAHCSRDHRRHVNLHFLQQQTKEQAIQTCFAAGCASLPNVWLHTCCTSCAGQYAPKCTSFVPMGKKKRSNKNRHDAETPATTTTTTTTNTYPQLKFCGSKSCVPGSVQI